MSVPELSELGYALKILERVEDKIEKLAEADLEHASQIGDIKRDLGKAIQDIDSRVKPVEQFVFHLVVLNKLLKFTVGALITLGGVISALAIFKEKVWTWLPF